MRSGNMTEALATGPEEAVAQSEAHINDYLFRGGADTEGEDVGVGEKFGVGELIKAAWANAKAMERAWLEQAVKSSPVVEERKPSSFLPGPQLPVEQSKEVREPKPFLRRNLGQAAPKPKPSPTPAQPDEEEPKKAAAAKQRPSREGTVGPKLLFLKVPVKSKPLPTFQA
jgi:hypothetical protein